MYSTEGYRNYSRDVNNYVVPSQYIIPSPYISMEGVDIPLLGTDDLGNQKVMSRGVSDYIYPGNEVYETPLANYGGDLPKAQFGWLKKLGKFLGLVDDVPIEKIIKNTDSISPYETYLGRQSKVKNQKLLNRPSAYDTRFYRNTTPDDDIMAPMDFINTRDYSQFGVQAPTNMSWFTPHFRSGWSDITGKEAMFQTNIRPKNPILLDRNELWSVERIKEIVNQGHDAIIIRGSKPNTNIYSDDIRDAYEIIPLDKNILENLERIKQDGGELSEAQLGKFLKQGVGDFSNWLKGTFKKATPPPTANIVNDLPVSKVKNTNLTPGQGEGIGSIESQKALDAINELLDPARTSQTIKKNNEKLNPLLETLFGATGRVTSKVPLKGANVTKEELFRLANEAGLFEPRRMNWKQNQINRYWYFDDATQQMTRRKVYGQHVHSGRHSGNVGGPHIPGKDETFPQYLRRIEDIYKEGTKDLKFNPATNQFDHPGTHNQFIDHIGYDYHGIERFMSSLNRLGHNITGKEFKIMFPQKIYHGSTSMFDSPIIRWDNPDMRPPGMSLDDFYKARDERFKNNPPTFFGSLNPHYAASYSTRAKGNWYGPQNLDAALKSQHPLGNRATPYQYKGKGSNLTGNLEDDIYTMQNRTVYTYNIPDDAVIHYDGGILNGSKYFKADGTLTGSGQKLVDDGVDVIFGKNQSGGSEILHLTTNSVDNFASIPRVDRTKLHQPGHFQDADLYDLGQLEYESLLNRELPYSPLINERSQVLPNISGGPAYQHFYGPTYGYSPSLDITKMNPEDFIMKGDQKYLKGYHERLMDDPGIEYYTPYTTPYFSDGGDIPQAQLGNWLKKLVGLGDNVADNVITKSADDVIDIGRRTSKSKITKNTFNFLEEDPSLLSSYNEMISRGFKLNPSSELSHKAVKNYSDNFPIHYGSSNEIGNEALQGFFNETRKRSKDLDEYIKNNPNWKTTPDDFMYHGNFDQRQIASINTPVGKQYFYKSSGLANKPGSEGMWVPLEGFADDTYRMFTSGDGPGSESWFMKTGSTGKYKGQDIFTGSNTSFPEHGVREQLIEMGIDPIDALRSGDLVLDNPGWDFAYSNNPDAFYHNITNQLDRIAQEKGWGNLNRWDFKEGGELPKAKRGSGYGKDYEYDDKGYRNQKYGANRIKYTPAEDWTEYEDYHNKRNDKTYQRRYFNIDRGELDWYLKHRGKQLFKGDDTRINSGQNWESLVDNTKGDMRLREQNNPATGKKTYSLQYKTENGWREYASGYGDSGLSMLSPEYVTDLKKTGRGSISQFSSWFDMSLQERDEHGYREWYDQPFQRDLKFNKEGDTWSGWNYYGDKTSLTYTLNRQDLRSLPPSLVQKYNLVGKDHLRLNPNTGEINIVTETGSHRYAISQKDMQWFQNPGRLRELDRDVRFNFKEDNALDYLNNYDFRYWQDSQPINLEKKNITKLEIEDSKLELEKRRPQELTINLDPIPLTKIPTTNNQELIKPRKVEIPLSLEQIKIDQIPTDFDESDLPFRKVDPINKERVVPPNEIKTDWTGEEIILTPEMEEKRDNQNTEDLLGNLKNVRGSTKYVTKSAQAILDAMNTGDYDDQDLNRDLGIFQKHYGDENLDLLKNMLKTNKVPEGKMGLELKKFQEAGENNPGWFAKRLSETVNPIGYDINNAIKGLLYGERQPFTWDGIEQTYDTFGYDSEGNPIMDPNVEGRFAYGDTEEKHRINTEYIKNASMDAWLKYLGLPQKNKTFVKSEHIPTIRRKDEKGVDSYWKFNMDDDIWDLLVNLKYEKGEDIFGDNFDKLYPKGMSISDSGAGGFTLKNFNITKGYDDELGLPYLAYHDEFDFDIPTKNISGFKGYPARLLFGDNIKGEQIVGKPYDIYGRMYYDPSFTYDDGSPARISYEELNEIGVNKEELMAGIIKSESLNGTLMKNNQENSTATGLYGQRFSELLDNDLYSGDRDAFEEDIQAQNEMFNKRFDGTLFENEKGLEQSGKDLYYEFRDDIGTPYSQTEISALTNFLGRKGARKFLRDVIKDGKSLEEIFPNLYGEDKVVKNLTPYDYIDEFRDAIKQLKKSQTFDNYILNTLPPNIANQFLTKYSEEELEEKAEGGELQGKFYRKWTRLKKDLKTHREGGSISSTTKQELLRLGMIS